MSEPLYVVACRAAERLVEREGEATVPVVMVMAGCSASTARSGMWRAWNRHWPEWRMPEGPGRRLVLSKKIAEGDRCLACDGEGYIGWYPRECPDCGGTGEATGGH